MILYLKCTDYASEEININKDLVLQANNDNILDLFILDDVEDGVLLTGAMLYFIVKENPGDSDSGALISKSYDDTTFPNAIAGEAAITILKEWTENLVGNFIYQIAIEFPNKPMKTIAEGIITFKKDILLDPAQSDPYPLPPYAV